jgi:HD-GYP domain-containing protein (c-di-GMP phosphodiesterase class II)
VRALGQLAETLSEWLGRLDIVRCAIGIGDPGPDGKRALRPVIRYARGEGASIDYGRDVPPSSLVAEIEDSRVRIVESLSLSGERYGIAVFGLGEPLGAVTAALRRQISGALKNIRSAEEGEAKRSEILALNADLQRQLGRISSLRLIDTAITGRSGNEDLLETLLEQTTIQLGVDAASILLATENASVLEFGSGRGFRTDALRHTRLSVGEGFAGRAARDRELVLVRDLERSPESLGRAPLLRDEGFVAYCAAPLFARGNLMGVLEVFTRSPLSPDEDWKGFLQALAGQAAIALDSMALVRGLRDANGDLLRAYDETIEGWSRALDLRDRETEGHSLRVADQSAGLARSLGLGSEELALIYRGALLHDIGKVGIPDAVLLKQGSLDEGETRLMRMHPGYAYDLLHPIAYLRPVIDIPYCHHERWDGTGYPRALRGEGIPLHARIFAVVDVWDALISDRPYRKAWPKEKALDHIARGSAGHFDPAIADAFLKTIG